MPRGVYERTEEHKRRISENHAKYWKDKKFSDEHRQKISDATKGNIGPVGQIPWNKGLTKFDDHRILQYANKISMVMKEKYNNGELPHFRPYEDGYTPSNKGKTLSEKTKQKIREARLRQVLPQRGTKIEIMLRDELNKLNISHETNVPICGICEPDIVLRNEKIAIFADGDYWHSKEFDNGKRWERDKKINQLLQENGWKVFRFWGSEIKENTFKCIEQILEIPGVESS